MSANKSYFDSESVHLMGRVCDEVWRELIDSTLFISADSEAKARRRMASKVLEAVAAGERDPARLKALAFAGLAEN
jgi:DICT domain-containing protein